MSLINDALKKAAKGKGPPEGTPSFGSQGFDIAPPMKKGMDRKRLILFGVLGTLVLVIAIVITTRSHSRLPVTQQELQEPVRVVKEEVPQVSPEMPPSLPSAPPPPPSISIESPLLLSGIVHGEGEELAVLNNQISRVGDDIEGATLLEVGRDFVVLQKGEKQFKLKMK